MSIGKIRNIRLAKALDAVTTERDKWFMAAASEEQRADQRTMERDELQRRIDAIEKLHHQHDCKADPCGWRGPSGHCYERGQCAGCGDTFPCLTAKAARGEL